MSVAYYNPHTGRRLTKQTRSQIVLRKVWRNSPIIGLIAFVGMPLLSGYVLIALFLGLVGNELFNPSQIAERAMLSNTRTFGVMCPTPGMTADQLVLWHAYAARKNLPAYPEAGPNCYDP